MLYDMYNISPGDYLSRVDVVICRLKMDHALVYPFKPRIDEGTYQKWTARLQSDMQRIQQSEMTQKFVGADLVTRLLEAEQLIPGDLSLPLRTTKRAA